MLGPTTNSATRWLAASFPVEMFCRWPPKWANPSWFGPNTFRKPCALPRCYTWAWSGNWFAKLDGKAKVGEQADAGLAVIRY